MDKPLSALHNKYYAELLQTLEHTNLEFFGRTLREGTLTKRTIRGRPCWYFKKMTAGVVEYVYVGPDSPALATHIDRAKTTKAVIRQLAGNVVRAGGYQFRGMAANVLEALSDAGVFAAGTVLVGTNAFLSYQSMLGLVWKISDEALSTGDIDFAHVAKLALGVPLDVAEPVRESLLRLEAKPLHKSLLQKGPPWTYQIQNAGVAFDIEFLTPLTGPEPKENRTVPLPWLGVAAQPLRFMDYLLENAVKAAVVPTRGALLVNIPDPGRFALHKLIVAERRPAKLVTKKRKDRLQAAAVIEALAKTAPEILRDAWTALVQKQPTWGELVKESAKNLPPQTQDVLWPQLEV